MSDVPRPLLVALKALPVATRYALTVVWTYLPARDAEEARRSGRRARVRVPQVTVADITGENTRSVRRHLERLEEVGAVSRCGRELELATIPEHLRTGPTSPRTDESAGPRRPVKPDRRVRGPTSPPDPWVPPNRTDESSKPDRRVLHKPLLVAPREEAQRTSSSSYTDKVRALRPFDDAVDTATPRGLDARSIIAELHNEVHPPGALRMRGSGAFIGDLVKLLAGDGETPGEEGREVLRVARSYLRIIRDRVRVKPGRNGAPAQPEEARWWGPSMFQPQRWAVICQIVATVEGAEARLAEPTRRADNPMVPDVLTYDVDHSDLEAAVRRLSGEGIDVG